MINDERMGQAAHYPYPARTSPGVLEDAVVSSIPEVSAELADLRGVLKMLPEIETALRERLMPVLRPEPSQTNSPNAEMVIKTIVPLATEIREIRWSIEKHLSVLEAIIRNTQL